jgi:RNA polymerase sigma factor (sigma-70 family)
MAKGQLGTVIRQIRKLAGGEMAEEVPDRFLLQRFVLSRDEDAFAELVQRHGQLVLDVCRHLLRHEQDAEDAFQAAFLVLAKKAGSIRNQDSLAAWLYGVAYRIAMNAKSRATSRRLPTKPRETMPAPEPPSEASLHEVQTVLHEEVSRLPEKLRAPFVLCCLEGKSRAEAAQLLGWKDGTLSGRLAQARDRLQKRLTRRGVALSAALGAAALSSNPASAIVPANLVDATVHAALLFTTGKAGAVSAQALSLAEGAMKTMVLSKVKTSLALVLGASLLAAGVGWGAYQSLPAKPEPSSDPAAQPAAKVESPPKPAQEKQARTDLYGDPLPAGAVARLGTARFRNGLQSWSVVFSPDGKTVATASHDMTIRLWDVASGKELRQFRGHHGAVLTVAFSPDGKLLASGSQGDPMVRLWQVNSGKDFRQLQGHQGGVTCVAFYPDGKILASGGQDHVIRLWKVATGQEIRQFIGHQGGVQTVAFSPDGKSLASGENSDNTIRLWEVATGKEFQQLRAHKGMVYRVTYSVDGKVLASSGEDQTIRLWDVAKRKEIRQLLRPQAGENAWATGLAFAPDGKTLASGGGERTIVVWELGTGKVLRELKGHQSASLAVAFSPDGRTLASAGADQTVRLWDVTAGQEIHPPQGHQHTVCSVAFSPDGRILASGGVDQTIRLWEPTTGKEIRQLRGLRGYVMVAFSPDGKTLASKGLDGLCLWETATGKEIRQLREGPAPGRALAFSPDGTMVASGGAPIHLWHLATGQQTRQLPGPQQLVSVFAFSPDNKRLASGETDGSIRLWDVATGRETQRFFGDQSEISFLTFSPDGKTLAASSSGIIRWWDLTTSKEVYQLPLRGGPPAFSPDGRTLAYGNNQGTVTIWEVFTGKKCYEFAGHRGWVSAVAFSPDGRSLASGSTDTTILVWDVSGLSQKRRPQKVGVTPKNLEMLWYDLASADAAKAYQAIWILVGAPKQSLPFLKEHLHPAPSADSKRIDQLVHKLDSERFVARDEASKELTNLGEMAEPALRKALQNPPSLETRRRVEELLETLRRPVASGQKLQGLRAVQVLEHIGTPEAQQILKTLATGAPEARLTQEAKATLARLSNLIVK